ncbi:MAG: hypothetical protein GIKADHBN_00654 [Phycisphaerales bacterium]|nr:hypothetical protein [Phycisphaerales bacterium]MCK6475364.1 PilZ domain-containing protein [Phycisphaerales bacterium]
MSTTKAPTGDARPNSPANAAVSNSVRLDMAKLNALLDELDRRDGQHAVSNRQYVRWPFRHLHLPLTVSHLGGSKASVRVACRNLSCGGVSVLHSSYLYPGSRCEVTLPHNDGTEVTVKGTLARCSHLSGIVHEVGIKFDAPVKIADFVELSPQAGAFSLERVDPGTLRGTLIYVTRSELDQRLMRHYLRETQVRLHIIAKPEDVIAKALAGVDLIICEAESAARPDSSILPQLRQSGVASPVIVILPFTTQKIKPPSREKHNLEAYISKPFTQSVLLQAIAEFIMMDDGKGLTSTSLPAGHPSAMLVDSFINEVHAQAKKLEEAVRASSLDQCLVFCQQIAGVAPLVGFEKLSELARQAEAAIISTMSLEESVGAVRRLIITCQNTRAKID